MTLYLNKNELLDTLIERYTTAERTANIAPSGYQALSDLIHEIKRGEYDIDPPAVDRPTEGANAPAAEQDPLEQAVDRIIADDAASNVIASLRIGDSRLVQKILNDRRTQAIETAQRIQIAASEFSKYVQAVLHLADDDDPSDGPSDEFLRSEFLRDDEPARALRYKGRV
jgi:hypothetical protein